MNDIQIRKVAFGGYHREDVEKVLSQWQSTAAQQKEALRTAQAERDALVTEREALGQTCADLRAELEEKARENAALQSEKAALQAALDGKAQENSHLTRMLREVQQSCDALADELNTQEAALDEQRHLFDKLLQEYGKLESKLERCNQVGRLAKEGGSKAAQALTGVAAQLQEIRSQVQEVDAALDRDGLVSQRDGPRVPRQRGGGSDGIPQNGMYGENVQNFPPPVAKFLKKVCQTPLKIQRQAAIIGADGHGGRLRPFCDTSKRLNKRPFGKTNVTRNSKLKTVQECG